MNLTFSQENFANKKVMVATPMYGGQCAGMFTKSCNDLAIAATKYQVPLGFYYLFNESLITRARNYCVDEFLRSDATHLMFIDSDIGFDYRDVLALTMLCNDGDHEQYPYQIITGPYPKKTIAWEKIKRAVDLGYANEQPFVLENFVGDFVFNLMDGKQTFDLREPVKVREAGTGFMMIHRSVFEKYRQAYPEQAYLPDHVRTEHFDGSREIHAYFDCIIDPESKRYLSEDYMFCYNAQKIGIDVWMCPWMKLSHVGSYTFGGSVAAMAQLQMSPTASVESNKKHWDKGKAVEQVPLLTGQASSKNRAQRRAEKSKKAKG